MFNSHFICAFPFIPFTDNKLNEEVFGKIIDRLKEVEMPFICAGAPNGASACLSFEERIKLIELIKEHAPDSELMVDVSSFKVLEIMSLAKEAVKNDANALMLTPLSLEELTADESIDLFESLNSKFNIPVCVYESKKKRLRLTDDFYTKVASVSAVKSICLSDLSPNLNESQTQVKALKEKLPQKITLGFSDDTMAGNALFSGCELWFSALASALPKTCIKIALAAATGNKTSAMGQFCQLSAIIEIMKKNGVNKTLSALLEIKGLINESYLLPPVKSLNQEDKEMLKTIVSTCNFE